MSHQDSTQGTTRETAASFEIAMQPGDPTLETTARFDFTKTWSGGMEGTSRGVMLSGGDPQQGEAGYVAIEVFNGRVDGLRGSMALQQFGTMHSGDYALRYEIVPGSSTDELTGTVGSIDLVIADGNHNVTLRYTRT